MLCTIISERVEADASGHRLTAVRVDLGYSVSYSVAARGAFQIAIVHAAMSW